MKLLITVLAAATIGGVAHAGLDEDYQAWARSLTPDVRAGFVNSKVCVMLADIALTVGKLRDAGLSREELLEKATHVRQDGARTGSAMVVNYSFDNPNLSPQDLFYDVAMSCKKIF